MWTYYAPCQRCCWCISSLTPHFVFGRILHPHRNHSIQDRFCLTTCSIGQTTSTTSKCGGRMFWKKVASHSLAKLQRENLVNRGDKPINCNNKYVQIVFLMICLQEVVVHSGNTFTHALVAETFEYSMKVHRGFKDHMRTSELWVGSQPQLVTWPQLTACS